MSWKGLITARAFDVVGEPADELLKANGCEVVIPDQFGPLAPDVLQREMEGMDAVVHLSAIAFENEWDACPSSEHLGRVSLFSN